eukprot:TRINITY_DN19965_c0_g1_i1.p1 TRINITY_DN19965_c0_g1~~TRINITY_DN19965_c0_g1_i1.p1  ORF type:complete len:170 (+),score=5.94 TRINITY_DN19965_c0_g1_i1:193-702(+)
MTVLSCLGAHAVDKTLQRLVYLFASFKRSPSTAVLLHRSEPARSLTVNSVGSSWLSWVRISILVTKCDLLDTPPIMVVATWRFVRAASMCSRAPSTESTTTSVAPSTMNLRVGLRETRSLILVRSCRRCSCGMSKSMSSSLYTSKICLLYTSDAADEEDSVDLGGRRIN